ncbi:hypothetical protein NC652_032045 [Populus alba x Populus x berolinensis]|nr:hypothetical protein NC652_032045 [Populus alba x Populus x berolinensis]
METTTLLTLSRANYRPYGIDFRRVSLVDLPMVEHIRCLGSTFWVSNYIPPIARTRGPALLRDELCIGAAGIRDETGNNRGVTPQ